jgi:hypothetical protein
MVADTSTIGVGVVSRLLGDLASEDLPLLLLGLKPLLFLKCLFVSFVHIIFEGVLTQHIL